MISGAKQEDVKALQDLAATPQKVCPPRVRPLVSKPCLEVNLA